MKWLLHNTGLLKWAAVGPEQNCYRNYRPTPPAICSLPVCNYPVAAELLSNIRKFLHLTHPWQECTSHFVGGGGDPKPSEIYVKELCMPEAVHRRWFWWSPLVSDRETAFHLTSHVHRKVQSFGREPNRRWNERAVYDCLLSCFQCSETHSSYMLYISKGAMLLIAATWMLLLVWSDSPDKIRAVTSWCHRWGRWIGTNGWKECKVGCVKCSA